MTAGATSVQLETRTHPVQRGPRGEARPGGGCVGGEDPVADAAAVEPHHRRQVRKPDSNLLPLLLDERTLETQGLRDAPGELVVASEQEATLLPASEDHLEVRQAPDVRGVQPDEAKVPGQPA